MDNTDSTQNIISYCTGIRGIEHGLERCGLPVKTIVFLEIEAFIVANLVAQMEVGLLDPAPIWTNIKTFDARPFRNKIHGIIGGYPCQPFSHAGERKGVDDERHLWPYILKQVEIIRPEWVYFENVAGHLSLGYEEVRRSLSGIGYRVEEGIFTAEEIGAPHRRERLFIFATMDNADILRWGRGVIGHYKERRESKNKIEKSSATLDHPNCECKHRCSSTCDRWQSKFTTPSGELADSNLNDSGTNAGYVSESKGKSNYKENKRERNRNELGSCNTKLADTGRVGSTKRKVTATRIEQQGEELAHSDSSGQPKLGNNGIKTEPCNTGIIDSGTILDDSVVQGLQGFPEHDGGTQGRQGQERPTAETSLFPAGQGAYQHEWEEPRTIESSLEYTIDGYNFTEDLHRAIGNSVVEQTAELAFISLLEKHLQNDR